MRKAQLAVAEFHRKYSHVVADRPTLDFVRTRLRARLCLEECIELCDALGERATVTLHGRAGVPQWQMSTHPSAVPSLVDAADAMADLIYVVLGTAVELGIDLEPVFEEVQRSNMSKSTDKAPDGKTIKGPNFRPPDIARIIAEQLGGGCTHE